MLLRSGYLHNCGINRTVNSTGEVKFIVTIAIIQWIKHLVMEISKSDNGFNKVMFVAGHSRSLLSYEKDT